MVEQRQEELDAGKHCLGTLWDQSAWQSSAEENGRLLPRQLWLPPMSWRFLPGQESGEGRLQELLVRRRWRQDHMGHHKRLWEKADFQTPTKRWGFVYFHRIILSRHGPRNVLSHPRIGWPTRGYFRCLPEWKTHRRSGVQTWDATILHQGLGLRSFWRIHSHNIIWLELARRIQRLQSRRLFKIKYNNRK